MKIELSSDTLTHIICVVFISIGFSFFMWIKYIEEPKIEREKAKEAAAWAAAECPVYKSICGSKSSTYVCERKAVIVGRNQVGDIFVDAYPICRN
jgi:hypothetical protein